MFFKNQAELISNGQTPILQRKRRDALNILNAAIRSVDPYSSVSVNIIKNSIRYKAKFFRINDFQRAFLIGFGKASVGMAQAVCDKINVTKGLVITNDPNAYVKHPNVRTIHGGHPLPNQNSMNGTQQIEHLINECTNHDLVIVVISGGGSSLLCHPQIPLSDLQKTTELLLNSGVPITDINVIRKHLSYVKGGKLFRDATCTVIAFIISDVVNNPLSSIASGPTYNDTSTYQDAFNILRAYHLWNVIPRSVKKIIEEGIQSDGSGISSDNATLKNVHNLIVASNTMACKAAFKEAINLGYKPKVLSTLVRGVASQMGRELLNTSRQLFQQGHTTLCIASGETTVKIQGKGDGGRNQEMVLSVVEDLAGSELVFVSCATDGVDGVSPAAGAIADGKTAQRAKNVNIISQAYLMENNSFWYFEKLKDVLLTGPTGTNVMDIQLIL